MHGSCEVLCRLGSCPKDKEARNTAGLPDGHACGECVHYSRCQAIFGCSYTSHCCDWDPHRFRMAEPTSAPPSGPPLGPNQIRIWVRNPAMLRHPGGSVWVPAASIGLDDQNRVVTAVVELDDGHMGEMENMKDGLEIQVETAATVAERERCATIVREAREYCRNRKYGKETMLDNMASYALVHINPTVNEAVAVAGAGAARLLGVNIEAAPGGEGEK